MSIENEYKEAIKQVGQLTARDFLIAGASLYWAEGSKKETGAGFNFVNSDPKMVAFMYTWLHSALEIKKEDIILNVAINESHGDRIKEILNFWSSLLDLSVNSFGNTTFIHSPYKRIYINRNSYQGMIRMKVRRSSSWNAI